MGGSPVRATRRVSAAYSLAAMAGVNPMLGGVCQWFDRFRVARRVRRLEVENRALRAAVREAQVLVRVWRMSAEKRRDAGDREEPG